LPLGNSGAGGGDNARASTDRWRPPLWEYLTDDWGKYDNK